MNEFVARKGLISLQSASFEQALWVSGSISSPVEALITSSWAINSVTASYATVTEVDYNKIYSSLSTGSQTISAINTWQENIFNVNVGTSSHWIHPTNTGQFTCSKSDVYEIDLHVRMQKTSGGNQSAGIRILKNNNEITGSYSAITYTSNNVASDMYVNIVEPISSGSNLRIEIIGTATTIQTTSFPIFGSSPGFSYSSKILIIKT